jgi:hypothetical protein
MTDVAKALPSELSANTKEEQTEALRHAIRTLHERIHGRRERDDGNADSRRKHVSRARLS